MSATDLAPDTKRPRDFSDWAVFRATTAAALSAYVLLAIFGILQRTLADLAITGTLPPADYAAQLANTFTPMLLIISLPPLYAAALIGVFVLSVQKGGRTSYADAARAGAKTGAIALAIILVMFFIPVVPLMLSGGGFSILVFIATQLLVVMAIGALSGLAARWAAGRPTIELQQDASESRIA
jgi:hypothetical protein